MFFNYRGTGWVLFAILVVVLLCVLDLRCSFLRDEKRAKESDAPQVGAIAHVKGEMSAGLEALAQQREEQRNEQLRTLRVMAKRFADKGDHKRARATIGLIMQIENEKNRQ